MNDLIPLDQAPDTTDDQPSGRLPVIPRNASDFVDLLLEGMTAADAAETLNVNQRTALKWLNNEDILDHIDERVRNRLRGAKAEAAGKLVGLLGAKSEKVRLEAARAILSESGAESGARVYLQINLGG